MHSALKLKGKSLSVKRNDYEYLIILDPENRWQDWKDLYLT